MIVDDNRMEVGNGLAPGSDRGGTAPFGFDVDEHVRAARNRRPDDWWVPCLSNTTGETIDGLEVTEITDLLRERLTGLKWPATMRVIVRRRKLFDRARTPLTRRHVRTVPML